MKITRVGRWKRASCLCSCLGSLMYVLRSCGGAVVEALRSAAPHGMYSYCARVDNLPIPHRDACPYKYKPSKSRTENIKKRRAKPGYSTSILQPWPTTNQWSNTNSSQCYQLHLCGHCTNLYSSRSPTRHCRYRACSTSARSYLGANGCQSLA